MANLISELTAAAVVDHDADLIWVEQSGLPRKASPNNLLIVLSTTAALVAIANAVNTQAAKVAGFQVFNTTTGAPVWAVGDTDGALWNDATGATAHTPA